MRSDRMTLNTPMATVQSESWGHDMEDRYEGTTIALFEQEVGGPNAFARDMTTLFRVPPSRLAAVFLEIETTISPPKTAEGDPEVTDSAWLKVTVADGRELTEDRDVDSVFFLGTIEELGQLVDDLFVLATSRPDTVPAAKTTVTGYALGYEPVDQEEDSSSIEDCTCTVTRPQDRMRLAVTRPGGPTAKPAAKQLTVIEFPFGEDAAIAAAGNLSAWLATRATAVGEAKRTATTTRARPTVTA